MGATQTSPFLVSIGIFIFCVCSVSSYRACGGGPMTAGEEGTEWRSRGTTTAPQPSQPPYSVDADAGSTLRGLERLAADLCRSLGGVSARPSAVSDPL